MNEIPGRKTREFQTGAARSQEECIEPAQCGLLPRKTEQSYATGRNPRNDFLPSYAVYIARAGPRHASFVSAVSTCKNSPVWNALLRKDGWRTVDRVGGILSFRDRVDTWPRVGIHHPSVGVAEARWWRGS